MTLNKLTTIFLSFLLLLVADSAFAAQDPNKVLVLSNQFGEVSINTITSAGLPLANKVTYFSGAGAPVNGGAGTGVGFAGPGSIYGRRDTGALYLNANTAASPTWSALSTGGGSVLATVLTGYSSAAGTVSAADTLLVGINKLNGNQVLSKATADAALPSASFTDAAVTSKLLTGYVSGAGAVAATDTILQGINKLNGNTALKANIANATMTGNFKAIAANGTSDLNVGNDELDIEDTATIDWVKASTTLAFNRQRIGTDLLTNGVISQDVYFGQGGSVLSQGAMVYVAATENWTSSQRGTKWAVQTKLTAANTLADRLYVDGVGVTVSPLGFRTQVSVANVSNPPTQAELISTFGTAAAKGAGWVGYVNDNAGGTAEYLVTSDATNFFYVLMTVAP